MTQNGSVELGENTFESMTDTDMANILAVAMEEAIVESVTEEMLAPENNGALMEGTLPEDKSVLEVSIVRLDKKAKKQKAYKLAILQCAKDAENKDYKKLETLWRMEKFLFRKLEKKYAARARSRMNQTANKASGNHPVVKKAKGGLTRSQKETQKALAGQTKPPTQIKNQFKTITAKLKSKV